MINFWYWYGFIGLLVVFSFYVTTHFTTIKNPIPAFEEIRDNILAWLLLWVFWPVVLIVMLMDALIDTFEYIKWRIKK